jgi:hypothetical protein
MDPGLRRDDERVGMTTALLTLRHARLDPASIEVFIFRKPQTMLYKGRLL